MITPNEKRRALLAEMHKAIAEASQSAVDSIGSGGPPSLSYPPGIELSSDELRSLSELNVSPQAKETLKKIISDACSYPLFHLCSLLDGVTEPHVLEVEGWTGGSLEFGGNQSLMLHDEFYESYWDYEKSS